MKLTSLSDKTSSVWPHALLLAALCVSVGAFLINEVDDLDVWWQVVIGRDILANWAVPAADKFAAAALGRPYHDSHWFFQVMLAAADRLAGMAGVQLVMVAVWTAILFCCQRAVGRWVPAVCSTILLFLAAMASVERFLPRPEIITFLGIAFFYWRLQEGKYRSLRQVTVLVLMQLLWVNSHGLFVLGPFLVGCYWLTAAIGTDGRDRKEFVALSRLLAMVLAATLATPFGLDGWRYALLLFQEAGPAASHLLKSVGELSPTFGAASRSGTAFWFFAVLLVVTAGATGLALQRRQRVPVARLLIVAGLLAAALTGRRNMVLFALVAAPFAAEQLRPLLPVSVRAERLLALGAAVAMLGWSWFPLSGGYYLMMEIPSRFGWGATPSFFPHGFPEFLSRIKFKGQVFNSNTIGGFYLYHGYPDRMPLTDGRWEIYDSNVIGTILGNASQPATWQLLVQRYDLRGVLLQHASSETRGLLPLLSKDGRWRLVYYDHAASFWVRTDAAPHLPPVDLSTAATLPPAERLDDCLMLNLFLRDLGADALRLRNLERALAFGRRTELLLADLGSTQIRMGLYDDAQRNFERLLQEEPKHLVALNELAFLAYRRNDLQMAESLLRLALEIDPLNHDAQANYQRVRSALGPGAGQTGR